MARELDDAILTLRTMNLILAYGLSRPLATRMLVLAIDNFILTHQANWFVREVLGMMRRTFARLDVTSRSMYAIVEPGSCFAGTLLELALSADRVFMRDAPDGETAATVMLSEMNFGALPMPNHLSRLAARFYRDEVQMATLRAKIGSKLSPQEAVEAGLVTVAPDESRLGRRNPPGHRIARRAFAGRPDRAGIQSPLRRHRNNGDSHFWPPFGLAKLDLHSAKCGGPERRPQGLRHRRARKIQLGKSLSTAQRPAGSNPKLGDPR